MTNLSSTRPSVCRSMGQLWWPTTSGWAVRGSSSGPSSLRPLWPLTVLAVLAASVIWKSITYWRKYSRARRNIWMTWARLWRATMKSSTRITRRAVSWRIASPLAGRFSQISRRFSSLPSKYFRFFERFDFFFEHSTFDFFFLNRNIKLRLVCVRPDVSKSFLRGKFEKFFPLFTMNRIFGSLMKPLFNGFIEEKSKKNS